MGSICVGNGADDRLFPLLPVCCALSCRYERADTVVCIQFVLPLVVFLQTGCFCVFDWRFSHAVSLFQNGRSGGHHLVAWCAMAVVFFDLKTIFCRRDVARNVSTVCCVSTSGDNSMDSLSPPFLFVSHIRFVDHCLIRIYPLC